MANLEVIAVPASQYWRPKIRGHQIGSKLKFHYSTHSSRFQNGLKRPNWTKIDELLLLSLG